ncbi:hypothetical protein, partial [Klebsiella pneumoniae]|uniref:hypothetical protein n=1 Tax=Klebsiella pneumoniae TaxID=573 RepID=UPI00117AD03B
MFLEEETESNIRFERFDINLNDIKNIILKMKSKNSCGLDGISIETIKSNIEVFTPLFYNIYSKSLLQGKFPDSFKSAAVVPIYKSGDSTLVSSYRPISLINTVAKIFEVYI